MLLSQSSDLAIVVQLVVRHLAKVEVAGSSPVYRSRLNTAEACKVRVSAVFVKLCTVAALTDGRYFHGLP